MRRAVLIQAVAGCVFCTGALFFGALMTIRIVSGDNTDAWRFNFLAFLAFLIMAQQAANQATNLILLAGKKE
jgi:hypothetical protein